VQCAKSMDNGNGVWFWKINIPPQNGRSLWPVFPTSFSFLSFSFSCCLLFSFPCGGALDKHMDGEMGNKRVGGYENKVTPDTFMHIYPLLYSFFNLEFAHG
jgi:hypothetical protein